MYDPYTNPPKFEQGGLTYIWHTNALPRNFDVSTENDSIIYRVEGGNTYRYEHARIGTPNADPDQGDLLKNQGYVGIYSLNQLRPQKL